MRSCVYIAYCYCWLVWIPAFAMALSNAYRKRVSIVTGANGYVGREVVSVLLNDSGKDAVAGTGGDPCNEEILCLVRSGRVESETKYWEKIQSTSESSTIRVLPYDMLDGGNTFEDALKVALSHGNNGEESSDTNGDKNLDICVYHIASVFGPSEDHIRTAHDNVQGTRDLVETLGKFSKSNACSCRLVVTSSMAAVRGSGQIPENGEYYTYRDWNTISKLEDNNWGSSYQWSKTESERAAWEVSKAMGIPMTTICPSFVFGPPTTSGAGEGDVNLSSSFSITLFGQWVRGESEVQSRLFVDIRDVARAHVAAMNRPEAIGQRIIASREARIPSQEMAQVLQEVCKETGLSDPENISFDSDFQGKGIPIGSREVDATSRLQDILGITLTPVHDTIRDMGRSLLLAKDTEPAK